MRWTIEGRIGRRAANGGRFDELRPRADDRNDAHQL